MITFRRHWTCAIFLLFSSWYSWAAPGIVVHGRVRQTNHSPLTGVVLSIVGDLITAPGTSDSDGRFSLQMVPSVQLGQEVTLRAEKAGFYPRSEVIIIASILDKDIVLTPLPPKRPQSAQHYTSRKGHVTRKSPTANFIPYKPGNCALFHTVTEQRTVTITVKRDGFHLASTREAGNNDQIDRLFSVTPDPGWSIVPNTSKFLVASSQGEWSHRFGGEDPSHVLYYVTTIHRSGGSSGSVDFSIQFTQSKTETTTTTKQEPITLNWGDSRLIQYPAGTWKLAFDAFNGSHAEFSDADDHNPFIKITKSSGGWIVRAVNRPGRNILGRCLNLSGEWWEVEPTTFRRKNAYIWSFDVKQDELTAHRNDGAWASYAYQTSNKWSGVFHKPSYKDRLSALEVQNDCSTILVPNRDFWLTRPFDQSKN